MPLSPWASGAQSLGFWQVDPTDQLNNLFNVTKHTLTNRIHSVHAWLPPSSHLPKCGHLIGWISAPPGAPVLRSFEQWIAGRLYVSECNWLQQSSVSLERDYQGSSQCLMQQFYPPVLCSNIYVKASTFQTEIKTEVDRVDGVFLSFCVNSKSGSSLLVSQHRVSQWKEFKQRGNIKYFWEKI